MTAFANDGIFGFSVEDCLGLGIWDGGASGSMTGVDQLVFLQRLCQLAFPNDDMFESFPEHRVTFTFANGESEQSLGVTCYWHHVLNFWIRFSFSVFDRPSPTLLGMDTQRELGIVIDSEAGTVWSRRFASYLPTVRLRSGHLALDLRPVGK